MKKSVSKIPKRYFTVKESIFNRRVHVFINYSHKEFAEWANKKGDSSYNYDDNQDKNFAGFSTELLVSDEPTEWLIVMKHFDWKIKEQGTLIHEIVHTIIKIWKNNNIPFTPDNQEFLAHEIGNLYEDIAAQIFNKKLSKEL